MKRIGVMLATVVIMAIALTGCGELLKKDENQAKVSWYTTSGKAANTRSFNSAGVTANFK